MKTFPLIICSLLLTIVAANAQVVAVQHDKENSLYVGENNALTIVAEGYPCKSLIVTINNGTISGGNGHYIAHPDTVSYNCIIYVKVKTPKGIKKLKDCPMKVIRRKVNSTR